MTNTEQFEKLTPALQRDLLLIAADQSERTIELLAQDDFILKEDIDDYIDDIDDDKIIEKAMELCEYDKTRSYEMFEAIFDSLDKISVHDISTLISEFLNPQETKELFNEFDEYLDEYEYRKNTLADEFKYDLLMQLYKKYSWMELEEKLKHLL